MSNWSKRGSLPEETEDLKSTDGLGSWNSVFQLELAEGNLCGSFTNKQCGESSGSGSGGGGRGGGEIESLRGPRKKRGERGRYSEGYTDETFHMALKGPPNFLTVQAEPQINWEKNEGSGPKKNLMKYRDAPQGCRKMTHEGLGDRACAAWFPQISLLCSWVLKPQMSPA